MSKHVGTKALSIVILTCIPLASAPLPFTTSAPLPFTTSAPLPFTKQLQNSRFLQEADPPRVPSCPHGYIDRTKGQAYYWQCAARCDVRLWADACCSCACVLPDNPMSAIEVCKYDATRITTTLPGRSNILLTTSESNFTKFNSVQTLPPTVLEEVQEEQQVPVRASSGNKKQFVPPGVILLLVLLSFCAFSIMGCACALVIAKKRAARCVPKEVAAQTKQSNANQIPASAVAWPVTRSVTKEKEVPCNIICANESIYNSPLTCQAPDGTVLSTQNLRWGAVARSLPPSPNQNQARELQLEPTLVQYLSPQPRLPGTNAFEEEDQDILAGTLEESYGSPQPRLPGPNIFGEDQNILAGTGTLEESHG